MARRRGCNHSHTFAGLEVSPEERDRRIIETFHRLAPYYDRLLDLQTLGLHRYWRRIVVKAIAPEPGQRILDVAGGCGEMAQRLSAPDRQVIVLEASQPMIEVGRRRVGDEVDWVAGLARSLPFPDASMDVVVCAFGIRNVTYAEQALREILRVLKPGARFYCLEVSRPWPLLRPLFYAYCRHVVPRISAWITRVPGAYEYLVDSILEFPEQGEIKQLFQDVGFTHVRFRNLTFGMTCLHMADKPN